jgi:hypothetical protein
MLCLVHRAAIHPFHCNAVCYTGIDVNCIVRFQFVPMRQFLVGGAQGQPVQTCQSALAKEVLAEIPDQVRTKV